MASRKGAVNMTERERLLKEIAINSFAALELHLFLDSHPNDKAALKMFNEYQMKYDALVEEYERRYGPINMGSAQKYQTWEWIKDPWPWDYNGGK